MCEWGSTGFFSKVLAHEDAINTTSTSIEIEWVNTKARVFFQPGASVVHGFEEVFIQTFSFLVVIRSNWRIESCQSTAEQKNSVEHLLWRGLNQTSLKFYTKLYFTNDGEDRHPEQYIPKKTRKSGQRPDEEI